MSAYDFTHHTPYTQCDSKKCATDEEENARKIERERERMWMRQTELFLWLLDEAAAAVDDDDEKFG